MSRDLEQLLREDWRGARVHGSELAPPDGSRTFRIRVGLVTAARPRGHDRDFVRPYIRCLNVHDYAIRPTDPNTIMGGPELELYRGTDHPLLWVNAPVCRLDIRTPPPNPQAAMLAIWRAHDAALKGDARWAFEHPLPAPDYVLQCLTRTESYRIFHGPQPLLEKYASALRPQHIECQCVPVSPHGQYIPGGDGELYDPPRDLKLLLLDQTYVVAETFLVEDEPTRPNAANT